MTKSWTLIFVMIILQLKTSKTQITTNARALIYLELHGSVAERIKAWSFWHAHLSRKEFTSRKRQLRSRPAVNLK